MRTRLIVILLSCVAALIFLLACRTSSQSKEITHTLTDRDRDGLIGPVKAVLTDDVVLVDQNGQKFESQQASSASIYDEQGKRTLQTPFRVNLPSGYAITQHDPLFNPAIRSRTVEETHTIPQSNITTNLIKTYDDKGNVIAQDRLDANRKMIEKSSISYEYDTRGNWIKRIISRVSEKSGQATAQPEEVSYRHIVYFDSKAKSTDNDQIKSIVSNSKQLNSPVPANEANIIRGRSLFNQKCIACHGENGKAQTDFAAVMEIKPKDLTSPEVMALTEGEIYTLIREGIKSSGMPAFNGRISNEALWEIALYVRRLTQYQATGSKATLASTSSSPAPKTSSVAPQATERRYQFKGKVVSVERELQQVTVDHEEIPGYMGAMTMPFPLKEEKVLNKLKKDDRIQATLIVDRDGWRLENVVIK